MLKCCYSEKKYLSKLKQHGLPDTLSEEFSFKCLSVMICEQFIVSIVELIMLSWQLTLLYSSHNMRVTWLFYHFFKLQVHTLHSLENISIFNPPGTKGFGTHTKHQGGVEKDPPQYLKNEKCYKPETFGGVRSIL